MHRQPPPRRGRHQRALAYCVPTAAVAGLLCLTWSFYQTSLSEQLPEVQPHLREGPVVWTPEDTAYFRPGEVWTDTAGQYIQAHGGGVLYHGGVFYWFGENKAGPTYNPYVIGYSPERVDVIGVSCYTSTDLGHWSNQGVVLAAGQHADLHPSRVLERPKVLFNNKTGKFVMWMHIDSADYEMARVGVASADRPTGPFRYHGSWRPHGQESRDMTVFQDDDGSAYLVYSSENNKALHVGQLSGDYLRTSGGYSRILAGRSREAPAVFKHRGTYLLLTSGCTGWEPNRAEVFTSRHMLGGEWVSLGNPASGGSQLERASTFFGQACAVLPLPGLPHRYIMLADQWDQRNLGASRYIWLPLWVIDEDNRGRLPRHFLAERSARPQPAAARAPVPATPNRPLDVIVRWFDEWTLADLDWPAQRPAMRPRPGDRDLDYGDMSFQHVQDRLAGWRGADDDTDYDHYGAAVGKASSNTLADDFD